MFSETAENRFPRGRFFPRELSLPFGKNVGYPPNRNVCCDIQMCKVVGGRVFEISQARSPAPSTRAAKEGDAILEPKLLLPSFFARVYESLYTTLRP